MGAIKEEDWNPYESLAYPNRLCWIAETVHAFGDGETKAYRLIVIRWPDEEEGLFKWEYHAVFTSLDDQSAGLILQFHRNRQDKSENVNKEMVYGFGMEKLPCREMKANAAYFQFGIISTYDKALNLVRKLFEVFKNSLGRTQTKAAAGEKDGESIFGKFPLSPDFVLFSLRFEIARDRNSANRDFFLRYSTLN